MPPKNKTKKRCDYNIQPSCVECLCGSTYQCKGRGEINHFNSQRHTKWVEENGDVTVPLCDQKEIINNNKRHTRKKSSSEKSVDDKKLSAEKSVDDKKPSAEKSVDDKKSSTTGLVKDVVNEVVTKITKTTPTPIPKTTLVNTLVDAVPTVVINSSEQTVPVITISDKCPLTNDKKKAPNTYAYRPNKSKYDIQRVCHQKKNKEGRIIKDIWLYEIFRILSSDDTLNPYFFTKNTLDELEGYKKRPNQYVKDMKDNKLTVNHNKLSNILYREDGTELTNDVITQMNITDKEMLVNVKKPCNLIQQETQNVQVKNQDSDKVRINIKVKRKPKPVSIDNVPEMLDKLEQENGKKREDRDAIKLITNDDEYNNFLYPELDDSESFNKKLLEHYEFNKFANDVSIGDTDDIDIPKKAEDLCKAEFELMPHQMFVKNFLSVQTPYNGLLLFHGLGTGKTCSAIGISEEMRNYIKQIGAGNNRRSKKIIVVASPNVQSNFRLQLFDNSKLKQDDNGNWNISACLGDSLLKEINPTMIYKMNREKVVENIERIIDKYYSFYGYTKFSNLVGNTINYAGITTNENFKKAYKIKQIKKVFSDTLIIIDEAHNIRDTDENGDGNRDVARYLRELAEHTDNLKLLLLTATPMFNNQDEIIWIINLLNANDKRSTISISDVFIKGAFKKGGKELIRKKLTGYISYVRGENPYTFPYRIYPEKDNNFKYPTKQMNRRTIENLTTDEATLMDNIPIKYVKIQDGSVQQELYNEMIDELNSRNFETFNADGKANAMKGFGDRFKFGYEILQPLIEALNMSYTSRNTLTEDNRKGVLQGMVGSKGLESVMKYTEIRKTKTNYEYKDKSKPGIFTEEVLPKHSAKISQICKMIKKSDGIIMVYSQYIDGGVIPVALALEEMGFKRRVLGKHKNLMKERTIKSLDVDKMIPQEQLETDDAFHQASYVMLTGDERFSPDNEKDLADLNNINNKDGNKIKVVLISRAAGEGMDFKNIRQVHIMEPWYNLSRLEQIIGRAVRNRSHCSLSFEKRNVEIFLYATQLTDPDVESPDMYLYRLSAVKANKIGEITRIMKENAVDCALKFGKTNFTENQINSINNNKENHMITISSQKNTYGYKGEPLTYELIKDKSYSDICDYMQCESMQCNVTDEQLKTINVHEATYTTEFAKNNINAITKRIREIFADLPKGLMFIDRNALHDTINVRGNYSEKEIDLALTTLIENRTEQVIDRYGRNGRIINKSNFYYFQPTEITDINATIYERSVEVRNKQRSVSKEILYKPPKHEKNIIDDMKIKFEECFENYDEKDEKWLSINKNNWYDRFICVYNELNKTLKIDRDILEKYVIYHIIDEMTFDEKHDLLNKSVNYICDTTNAFESNICNYFQEYTITAKNGSYVGILLLKENTNAFIPTSVIKHDSIWKYGNTSLQIDDIRYVADESIKHWKKKYDNMNKIFGLYGVKKSRNMVIHEFKIRERVVDRNKAGKRMTNITADIKLKTMNDIQNIKTYKTEDIENMEFIDARYNRNHSKHKIGAVCMDVLIEIILRYKQDNNTDNKTYFMNAEEFYGFKEYYDL